MTRLIPGMLKVDDEPLDQLRSEIRLSCPRVVLAKGLLVLVLDGQQLPLFLLLWPTYRRR